MKFKNIIFFVLLQHLVYGLKILPYFKSVPQFTYETNLAVLDHTTLLVDDKASLTTDIIKIEATTYKEAEPVTYSLINGLPHFKIDPTTGLIYLYRPFNENSKKKFKLTVVATDSAPFPDQQKSFLHLNISLKSSVKRVPKFNSDTTPYFTTVSESAVPGSLIFSQIFITDYNYGHEGELNVFCNQYDSENSDAKISCDYFSVKCKNVESDYYQCFILLEKKLNFDSKQNFILSIGAKFGHSISLLASANLVIEVKGLSVTGPYFDQQSYSILIDSIDTNLLSHVLEVKVLNVDLKSVSSNITFSLKDPNNHFEISNNEPLKCFHSYCSQIIKYITGSSQPTAYSMNIEFIQQYLNGKIFTTNANIYVVFKRSKTTKKTNFLKNKYQFEMDKSLEPGSVIRNLSFEFNESNKMSSLNSGFDIELLNFTDLTPATDFFEIVPNYIEGPTSSMLKLKQKMNSNHNGILKYLIKATSKVRNVSHTAELEISVKNVNNNKKLAESPFRQKIYTIVLNNPETYKINDELICLNDEFSENQVYNILGPFQDRFYIDSFGNVRLSQRLYPASDNVIFYNLTITTANQYIRQDFCQLVIYLNITLVTDSNSLFECAIIGAKSEIDTSDYKTLNPALFVLANSNYNLKFDLIHSVPSLDQIRVNNKTGQVYLTYPLNTEVLTNYDRIILKIQIYQLQNGFDSLYLSSVICSATIYLQSYDSPTITQNRPFFLRQYTTTIDRESVNKSVPLIKVDAVSRNPNNFMPINYKILNDAENYFVIDSTQGFIYSRYDYGLPIKNHLIQVQATDPSNLQSSITNVYISIIAKLNNDLFCNVDYLLLSIDPSTTYWNMNGPTILSRKINCMSNSYFNDTPILYDISRPLATFDCLGNLINYTPNIGVDSTNGAIVSFEVLNRNSFCDITFSVIAKKDQTSITIPVKLTLFLNVDNELPVFNNINPSYVTVPYYAYMSSYITTIIAFDPVHNLFIQNFSIKSQPINPNTAKPYFQIDSANGIIRLNSLFEINNNIPLDQSVQLEIVGTNINQKSSFFTLTIDLSQILDNYYATFIFNPNLPDFVVINSNNLQTNVIYESLTTCFKLYQKIETMACTQSVYYIDYIEDYNNDTCFKIDYQTGLIYMVSPNFINMIFKSEYLLVVSYLNFESNYLLRYQSQAFKSFKLLIDYSPSQIIPLFEFDYYSVNILDNTLAGSCILVLKYINTFELNSIQIDFGQESNLQVRNFFYLQHSTYLKTVAIYTIKDFIHFDKFEINFQLYITNLLAATFSFTQINIKIVSTGKTISPLAFSIPNGANNVINININDNKLFNSIIYKFQTNMPTNDSLIVYKILNKDANLFYIEKNFLRFIYPFVNLINSKRTGQLMFIKAIDINNPQLLPTFTTLKVNFVNSNPYFLRQASIGPLEIFVNDNVSIKTGFYNFSSLIANPFNRKPIYFYFYQRNYPYELIETFYIDPQNQLKLNKRLNAKHCDIYNLFIYLTLNSTCEQINLKPENENNNLLLIDIKVISSTSNLFNFIDITNYMFVEEFMQIDVEIGYAKANNSICSLNYYFSSCEYVSNSITYNDNEFCRLFKIDSFTGLISTNNSFYSPFLNDYFVLTVTATCNNTVKISTQIKTFVSNSKEKSCFDFSQVSKLTLNTFYNNLKLDINNQFSQLYANKILPLYYFDFYNYAINNNDDQTKSKACFNIIDSNADRILNYFQSKQVILSLPNIDRIFAIYSIIRIERYSTLEYVEIYDSLVVGIYFLVVFVLGVTIAVIIILLICWASHLKHALEAPTFDIETIDTDSNNELINE